MDTARERELNSPELAESGREIRLFVFVARHRAQPLRRDRDAGEGVAQALGCELDRQPLLVARADASGDAQLVLGRAERLQDRGERGKDLTAALVCRPDLAAYLLRGNGALVAKRRRDSGRVQDALERAPHASVLERETECVRRDIFEAVCL